MAVAALAAALAAGGAFAQAAGTGRDAFLKEQAVAEMQRVSAQVDILSSNQEELAERLRKAESAKAEIESLRAGDTLMVGGEAVEITSAVPMPIDPETPDVREMEINGGNDGDGFMMVASPDSNGYVVRMLSDVPTYTEQGVTSLMLDPECVYNDFSDLDAGTVSVSYDGIVDAIRGDATGFFVPYNTTITVADNKITAINREYVP